MNLDLLTKSPVGYLLPISGTDGRTGREYSYKAFVPDPLADSPVLQAATWQTVSRANRALGRLDQASLQVPNPALLRRPTLRREAQSTSALEGTFAPLERVLSDEDEDEETGPTSTAMLEILNYVTAAEQAFTHIQAGHQVTVSLLEASQGTLVRGTPSERRDPGRLRTIPVAIGAEGASIETARFVPMPPGVELRAGVGDLLDWVNDGAGRDPVVSAAMAHYQFETVHPFTDGNGRIGRMLIVLQLMIDDALRQPLLSVSPWFEAHDDEYRERLYNVSALGDWDAWIRFFSRGIEAAAEDTRIRVEDLLALQELYQGQLQEELPRSGIARDIVAMLIGYPYLTVPTLTRRLGNPTSQGVSKAVNQLVELGILRKNEGRYRHGYQAPGVMEILTRASTWSSP